MWNGTTRAGAVEKNLQLQRLPTWAQAIVLVLVLATACLVSGCAGIVGAGTPPPSTLGFKLNPGSIDFGSVAVGNKVPQQVSVVNTGTAPIHITALTVSAPTFSVSGATLPLSLGVGQAASFSVWFTSGTPGKSTATLTAQADGGAAPQVATLSGTVVSFSATPPALNFAVRAGTAITQNLLISNTSSADVTISQINLNAKDVTISGVTLPVTIGATQSVTATVQFKPVTPETVNGSITLVDAQGASLAVNVTAIGTQGVLTTLPTAVAFGNVVDSVTNSQPVQIINSGNGSLTVSQATVSGSGFFSVTGLSFPLVLAAGQSASFNVLFAPQLSGSIITGSLRLDSDGTNPSNILALSGTGMAAVRTLAVSQPSINFGSIIVGSGSSQAVTLTNTGNSNVSISQIAESGAGFSLIGAAAPLVLSPLQNTTITVNFDPTVAGSANGSVAVASDATGPPAGIVLSGTGAIASSHSVLLSWGASTTPTVAGYYLYRSTADGGGYAKLNSSSVSSLDYTDSAVLSGLTYYYVATAVDDTGIESIYSNQTSAIIP